MKPIEKLREILCTVPEIEKDLMELRIGTILFNSEDSTYLIYVGDGMVFSSDDEQVFDAWEEFEIIGNPIQERHLRMYCMKSEVGIDIDYDGKMFDASNRILIDILDNSKDLQDQNDSVIESIVEFLESNK